MKKRVAKMLFTNNKNKNILGSTQIFIKKGPVTLSLCASLLLLSGCNESIGDLDQFFAEERAKAAAPIPPIPEVKPYLRYAYPAHEKDPFNAAMMAPEPGQREVIDNGISVDTSRVPEFLEGYPLDSLKMVGTVFKDKTLWALVRIPDGAVQSVKAGNYLGQNYGKIVSISDVKLELKETVSNGLGGYKEKDTSIALNQDD